jgi:hypothetical protein
MKRGNEGRLTNGVKDKSKYVKLNSLYPLRAMKALLMIALVYGKHINSPRQLRRPQSMLGGTIHSKVIGAETYPPESSDNSSNAIFATWKILSQRILC